MQLDRKPPGLYRASVGGAVVLFCLSVLPQPSRALDTHRPLTQSFQRIWQLQQGLPRATIFAIRQTKDGYIWLGTQNGLVRFDGVRFVPVPASNGVEFDNLWVQDLAEDDQQNVWIATAGKGLIRLHDGDARQFTIKDGLPSDDVRCLAATKSGLWVGTSDGVARVVEDVTAYGAADGVVTTDVWAASEGIDGKVYFGGDGNQLSVWDGKAFTTVTLSSVPDRSVVHALLATPDRCVWAGTTAGLVRLEKGNERLFTTGDGLPHDSIFALAAGTDGCLWIGAKEGFSRLVDGKFESFRAEEGLSQSTACALWEDREGSLWVGTKHGLNQFTDRRAVIYTTREGLPSNDVGPILQDSQGTIWVGTLGAGLASYDGERFVTLTTSDGLPSNSIFALAQASDGDLWVGTDHGLAQLRNGKVHATFSRGDGLPSDSILCLLADRNMGLWVGTTQGVVKRNEERFEQPQGASDALSVPIRTLVAQGPGALLMAGGDGRLFRYADGELRAFRPDGLPASDVETIYVDAQGLLWISAPENGLFLYDGVKTRHFDSKDGLFDDEIFTIMADTEGRLWMPCSRGVFYVSREELLTYEAGKSKPLTCTPFTPTDASRTVECRSGVHPAVGTMQDGTIWFSAIRGVLVIDPKKLSRVLPPSPVVIEEVIVNGESVSPDKIVDLHPGDGNLEIRYAALSFVGPTRISFRYKLEGFDKDWIEAGGRREAYYTNLPPGTYQFRVMARKFNNEYEEAAELPPFTISPYFYQRIWFWPMCAALVGLAAWGIYRLRVRRIKDQMLAVVSERSRIARELHDTLMQGFSGVTMQMQAFATRLPSSDERESLQEIIRDAGVCLRDARRSIAGLRHEPEGQSGLATALTQAARQLTETHDVNLKLRVQRSLPALPLDVEYNLLRIAQEAISNAVKHAGASSIEVSLDRAGNDIQVTVLDNGHGFLESSGNGAPLGHFGLIGMRERASQIGADFHLESEPGNGTRICVTLPLARSERIANETLKSAKEV